MKRSALVPIAALAALSGLATLTAHPRFARANPGTLGFSGKPYNGVSETCSKANCHTGGTAPTLTLNVPQTMQAGSQAELTVTVAGNSQGTSLNAAVPSGLLVASGQNTAVPGNNKDSEITAITPVPAGATGTYKFRVTAPATNGPFMLWVAGMATDRNGTKAGDGVATATRTITVTGGAAPGADAGTRTDGGVVVTPPGGDGGQGEDPDDGGGGSNGGGDAGKGGGRGPKGNPGTDGEDDGSGLGGGAASCAMGNSGGTAGGAILTLSTCVMLAATSFVRRRRTRARR
ncbi:choice-of-anchor V domain-containing protein [Pendulispora albinea]|uniref:Uncharacterized protein n=1 Tax=Pendulispora albinea TaxID=2741071 RepID=A0ABZ2M9U7_9BACT